MLSCMLLAAVMTPGQAPALLSPRYDPYGNSPIYGAPAMSDAPRPVWSSPDAYRVRADQPQADNGDKKNGGDKENGGKEEEYVEGGFIKRLCHAYCEQFKTICEYQKHKHDYRDDKGMRTGFGGTYTSHAIGLSHNFNDVFQIRPEIGYYRNWNEPAFDLGTRRGIWLYGFDMTLRF